METKKALTTKNKNSYKSATNYSNNCNKSRNNKYPACIILDIRNYNYYIFTGKNKIMYNIL